MKANQIIPPSAAERAFTRWVESADGCLISTYSVASHGYAQIGWSRTSGRGMTTAHRAAWVHANGQIPDGMTIDHMCKNRRCVNVKHLRVLSNFTPEIEHRYTPMSKRTRGPFAVFAF